MKILFVNPSQRGEKELYDELFMPIGIMYLASAVRENNHQAEIVDLQVESLDDFNKKMDDFKPDVVGITSRTPTYGNALKMACYVKNHYSEIDVVFGGVHVSSMPEKCVKEEHVDYVIVGEGENSLPKLLDCIEGNKKEFINGVLYTEDGEVKGNTDSERVNDLDQLPLPAYDLVDINVYKKYNKGITVIASRGCPYNCNFCAVDVVFEEHVRRRSTDDVLNEIKMLNRKYDIERFAFIDDTFTLNRDWVINLCKKIVAEDLKLDWWCNTRVDTVDKEILSWMKKAGCREVSYGFESGNKETLNYINKGIDVKEMLQAVKFTRDIGMSVTGYFIINFPNETKTEILRTFKLASEISPEGFRISMATPFPGTELYEECKSKGLLHTDNWADFNYLSEYYIPNTNLSEAELKSILRNGSLKIFLNPRFLFDKVKKTSKSVVSGNFNSIRSGIKFVKNILKL